MKIKIYAIGKIKDFYKLGVDEYIKRLSNYTQVEVIEFKDEPIPDKPSESEILKAKKLEGSRVLSCLKDKEYLIALDLNKKEMTSEAFAEYLNNLRPCLKDGRGVYFLYKWRFFTKIIT